MTKNIVHIILACLVLFSTMGVTVERHYCQQQLKNMTVFITPKNCHGEAQKMATKGCCSNKNSAQSSCQQDAKNDNCCHNEGDFLKSDKDLISSTLQSYIPPLFEQVSILYTTFYQGFGRLTAAIKKPSFLYPTPKLRSIVLLVQAFLC